MSKNIRLYDTHCHLNSQMLIKNFDEITKICQQKKIILNCVGTNYKDSCIAVEQAKKYPNIIKATIGIHPYEIQNISDIKRLEELYLSNKEHIVACGEIGLDYYQKPNNETIKQQKLFFTQQIKLANKYNLPIIVHVRDQKTIAMNDCLELLKLHNKTSKVLIHFFTGDKEICKKIIAHDYYISLSGVITFKNSQEINDTLTLIPSNRLLIETDAPYATPVPYRGMTNKPYYLENIYEYLVKKLKWNGLQKLLLENSLTFFGMWGNNEN